MFEASAVSSSDSLWDRFCQIPDRRGRKGRQYGLPAVITLALAAMLAGADDLRAIFRWGRRLPVEGGDKAGHWSAGAVLTRAE